MFSLQMCVVYILLMYLVPNDYTILSCLYSILIRQMTPKSQVVVVTSY